MDRAGVDLVLATSKHNVQYLLGGYRFFFFAHMDSIGISRYVPALGYTKGHPELAFYVGNIQEDWQQEVEPLWVPTIKNDAWTSEEVASRAAELIRAVGLGAGTIALELAFLPSDSYTRLARLLPDAKFVDALPILEDTRAVKQPWELALIKEASELVVESMLAVFDRSTPGTTTAQFAEDLRQEETRRGLTFDYCLAATGRSLNRYPSGVNWTVGGGISVDSGGNKHGYIGDLARMAVIGSPTSLMVDLLNEIDAVQMEARKPIKAGERGANIFEHAKIAQAACRHGQEMSFVAHGMGLIGHEAPRLTSSGPVPYPASHAELPLEAGMVLSIETTIQDQEAGYVKLEDTVVVTETGWEAYGDRGRGWNVVEVADREHRRQATTDAR
jgi:Xaa-Pro aminopeptidase